MHDCPECGQACDCDGEDTYFDDWETYLNCTHVCGPEYDDGFDDEDGSDLSLEERQTVAAMCASELPIQLTGADGPLPEKRASEKPLSDIEGQGKRPKENYEHS
jgi:hypothetical protein